VRIVPEKTAPAALMATLIESPREASKTRQSGANRRTPSLVRRCQTWVHTAPLGSPSGNAASRTLLHNGGGTAARKVFRVDHPSTNLIVGRPRVTRTVKGWIDIKAAVEMRVVPRT
jgi:hypothetical protein